MTNLQINSCKIHCLSPSAVRSHREDVDIALSTCWAAKQKSIFHFGNSHAKNINDGLPGHKTLKEQNIQVFAPLVISGLWSGAGNNLNR